MSHWTENADEKGKFLSHVARVVLGVPMGVPVDANMLRDEVVLLAKNQPGIDYKQLGSVETAILTWDVWWSKNASDFFLGLVGDINMITVSASVRAGNTDLSIGLRLVPLDIGIHQQIAHAVKSCNILLEQQALSMGVTVTRKNAPASGQANSNGNYNKTVTFQADEIVVAHDGKRLTVKVMGGAFKRFGVPLYPEHAEPFGLKFDELKPGTIEWKHKVIAEVDNNGKPRRVINLKAD